MVDLLILASLDQPLFKIIDLFYKTNYLNKEVNCTNPSPSVSIPWFNFLFFFFYLESKIVKDSQSKLSGFKVDHHSSGGNGTVTFCSMTLLLLAFYLLSLGLKFKAFTTCTNTVSHNQTHTSSSKDTTPAKMCI
jgi:hypothetical protein